MRAALAGDERAYREFLRRAASLVRGFARRKITQGGVDPEDVVQETLLALHVKRHTWRTDAAVEPGHPGTSRKSRARRILDK
jgi:RNA polymerase sigma-70 factor (ECF subfamily)